jgi:hypothetical protein
MPMRVGSACLQDTGKCGILLPLNRHGIAGLLGEEPEPSNHVSEYRLHRTLRLSFTRIAD